MSLCFLSAQTQRTLAPGTESQGKKTCLRAALGRELSSQSIRLHGECWRALRSKIARYDLAGKPCVYTQCKSYFPILISLNQIYEFACLAETTLLIFSFLTFIPPHRPFIHSSLPFPFAVSSSLLTSICLPSFCPSPLDLSISVWIFPRHITSLVRCSFRYRSFSLSFILSCRVLLCFSFFFFTIGFLFAYYHFCFHLSHRIFSSLIFSSHRLFHCNFDFLFYSHIH